MHWHHGGAAAGKGGSRLTLDSGGSPPCKCNGDYDDDDDNYDEDGDYDGGEATGKGGSRLTSDSGGSPPCHDYHDDDVDGGDDDDFKLGSLMIIIMMTMIDKEPPWE